MEFYRRLFVLRGKPPRSIHSTETSFSFTPGTTVRFYVGIGSPLSPAPDPGSTCSWPGAAPAAAASNSISLMESPPAPGFSLIFRKQAVLFPPCQRGGPSLPASSQIAEQVTRSIAPPECPLHWANKRTRAHTHTHTLSFPHHPIQERGHVNGRSVALRKRPNSLSTTKTFVSPLGGKGSRQKWRHDEKQTKSWPGLSIPPVPTPAGLVSLFFFFKKETLIYSGHETFVHEMAHKIRSLNFSKFEAALNHFAGRLT